MKPRIFISAVSEEFKSARTRVEHVLEFLGYEVDQEDIWGTEAGDLLQMLGEKIDSCVGLVQIVGEGYGADLPSADPEHGRLSYTQFEFFYARAQEKKTWVLFAGPGCQRDTPVEKLDLPSDPTHPTPADYQAERRDLQTAYRARLHDEGHLWHSPNDDTALENAILKIRNDSEELRREFRDWQRCLLQGQRRSHTTFIPQIILISLLALLTFGGLWWKRQQAEKDTAAIKEEQTLRQPLNTARLRSHLQEASKKARAKDLADSETLQAAEAAYQQRLDDIEPIIAEFARIMGSAQATDVARELIRLADEQGIPEALGYLQSQRPSLLTQVASHQTGIREKLQPLLSGAQLALTAGDNAQAETLFRDLLKADPTWAQARYEFHLFLVWTQGTRAESHNTFATAKAIYQESLHHARRLTEDEPNNPQWQRALSDSYEVLGDVAVAQGNLEEAARLYGDGLKLREKGVQIDPGNAEGQYDLSFSYNKLGDVALEQGNLEQAARLFREQNKLAEKGVQSDPGNTKWQYDLSFSYKRLGDVAMAQGNLEQAAHLYGDYNKLAKKLFQIDPGNMDWWRGLSISYERLGTVAKAQGNLDQATRLFVHYNEMSKKLVQIDPGNTEWQRDLSVSYNRLGEVAEAQGNLEQAASLYGDALKLREKLAQSDPGNTQRQRDLSVSCEKLGDVAVAQGNLDQAARLFGDALKLAEKGVQSDPGNTQWQRDLSPSYNRLGEVAVAQGNLEEAARLYGDSLKVAEKLAQSDPGNTQWQRYLAASLYKLGDLHQRQEQWAQALPYFERSQSIFERLSATDPTNATWKKDVQVSRLRVQQVREKLGQ